MTLYKTVEQARQHPDGVTYDELAEMADEWWVMEDKRVIVTNYKQYHGEESES